MKKLLENATVFCISANGVMEGQHFLTLISWNPMSTSNRHSIKRRARTFSLPPSFDKLPGNDDEDNSVDFVKLSRSARSLSDDVLQQGISQQRRGNSSIDCLSALKLSDSSKKIKRKREVCKRKDKYASVTENKTRLNVSPKVYKTSVSVKKRKKEEKGSSCSAISLKMDGYMLSYFIAEMKRSSAFRSLFITHWSKGDNNVARKEGYPLLVFVAFLTEPKYEVLDLLGNKMVNSNILFRRSLEHALSWLSTLGGAFSALGDLSPSWAEEAGHVSLTQLRIGMKLGDPGIQSRCRLYAAISLLQRGYIKSCREIVKKEYRYAISLPEGTDPRLRRMCLGVWSKLQYHWSQVAKSDRKMLKSTLDGLRDIQNNAKYRNVYDLEEGRKIAVSVIDEDKLS